MTLDDREKKYLQDIAKSETGKFLVGYYEKIKASVADVRKPIEVSKPELENDIRREVCKAIDRYLVYELKRLNQDLDEPTKEWT